jgi:hypothetical protein
VTRRYSTTGDWDGARRRWIKVARMARDGVPERTIATQLGMNWLSVVRILDMPQKRLREVAAQLGEKWP